MKQVGIYLLSFFLLFQASAQIQKDPVADTYANTITATDLSEYLHVLASDSMEGRETGMAGQKKAADYLAMKFKAFGVAPGMKDKNGDPYFQKFDLVKKQWEDVYLNVNGSKKTFLQDFYVYGDLNYPQEIKTEVIFAGYGIETAAYSDYKELDKKGVKTNKELNIKNKSVIIFPGEPVFHGKSLITGDSNLSSWANDWRKKVSLAKSKGAKAVFIVVGNSQQEFDQRLDKLKDHLIKPTLGFPYKERPSAFFIPNTMAAAMLETTPDILKEALETSPFAAEESDILLKKLKQRTPIFKTGSISLKCSVKESKVTTENVLGFIEGSDKKDEVVILTAHYDHLGREGGQICYGADDDGSGTSALLEIAQAFAKAKKEGHGPRRSILIMPVTAEEKGLMGSEYYADHPVYPLQNTVADLNIDMIGRLDKAHEKDSNYVYIIGSNRLSTQLHEISEQVNRNYLNIHLDYTFNSFNDPNRFYYRSDHYNFAKNNIPVIFYFNGVHEDYHRPTDTVDKIIFSKAEKITRLVFLTAWELANMENRIEVNVKEE